MYLSVCVDECCSCDNIVGAMKYPTPQKEIKENIILMIKISQPPINLATGHLGAGDLYLVSLIGIWLGHKQGRSEVHLHKFH